MPAEVYDGQGFWLATKRLSKGRFRWWPQGEEPARTLRVHQAQVLLAAGGAGVAQSELMHFSLVFWHTADEMATHRYRSRDITGEQILFIRQLIADHPELSRWKLSRERCDAWQWKQPNGALGDMVCRGLLLMLDRAGEIELPPGEARRTQSDRVRCAGHCRASLRWSLYKCGARRRRRCSTA